MDAVLNVPDLLARNVELYAEKTAFIDGDRHISFREFNRMVAKTAAWLVSQGIGPGDVVAVWLVNRIEWLAMYGGLSHIGATMMTVNTRYRSHELEYILERSKAKMLVLQLNFRKIDFPSVLQGVNPEQAPYLQKIAVVDTDNIQLPDMILGKPTISFNLEALADQDVPVTGNADSLNILFTTSGTTGGPKLVAHPQHTVTLHNQRTAKAYRFEEEGVCLLAGIPFCGVFGFSSAFATFSAGKPVVIMDTFDAEEAIALIGKHQITHMFGSDELFRRLAEVAEGDKPFPSARIFGFATFHPGLKEFGESAWKRGIPMFGLYGSSEVNALFSLQLPGYPLEERILGGGVPASPDAEIRIRDIDTGEILPVGESGAIEIRAKTNFTCYLNNPEATKKAIDEDGFFRTGDIGYLREDGSFVYQTRQGDAIRLGGYLVSPVEIEEVIKQVPGVLDVQVVSVEIGNQVRAVAFAILQHGVMLAEQEMIAAAASSLAPFKVPARVWIINEFPATQSSNGTKIQRAKLRDMAMQKMAETVG